MVKRSLRAALSFVSAVVVVGVLAPPALADPYREVPAGHWSWKGGLRGGFVVHPSSPGVKPMVTDVSFVIQGDADGCPKAGTKVTATGRLVMNKSPHFGEEKAWIVGKRVRADATGVLRLVPHHVTFHLPSGAKVRGTFGMRFSRPGGGSAWRGDLIEIAFGDCLLQPRSARRG